MPNSAISFNTSGLASATSPGLVGTGAQTFAGDKTFNGLVSASGGVISSGLTGANATTVTASGSGKVLETFTGNASKSDIASNTATTIATIAIPSAGIWKITGVVRFSNNASGTTWTSGNDNYGYISNTTNSAGTGGTSLSQFNKGGATLPNVAFIGVLREVLQRTVITSAAQNYFMVAQCIYTGGIPIVTVEYEVNRIG